MHKLKPYYFLLLLTVFSCQNYYQSDRFKNVFRYNESKGITSLDPAFARSQTNIWPVNQLFNGLVQLDDSLQVVPCIARRWTVSSDGLVYTFILRKDVYFHDSPLFPGGKGRRVVAGDFEYSLGRLVDEKVASPGSWILNGIDKNAGNHFKGFVALNDSVFQISLIRPFPAFLGLLTMQYCSVVPREVVEHYGDDFRNHPIGTGPFQFKYWKEGEKLVLVKNPNYFEFDSHHHRLPYLDAVDISFIADKQSEFLEFMKGNIDFLSGVQSVYKDELITKGGKLNPKYRDRFVMLTHPYLNTEYLGFLLDSTSEIGRGNPFKDIRIRQAINYGFDRVKMVRYLRNNLAIPAVNGFVPLGMPFFSDKPISGYSYNPDKARKLLQQAGFPNGNGLPKLTLTVTSDYLDLCEFIQHELEQIGVKVNIDVSTGAKFKDMVANSKLIFFRGSWIADYADAENYLSLFYSKNLSPGGPNTTHFSDPLFDQLYDKSLKEFDVHRRIAYYKQMDQMIVDQAAVVPLYYDIAVRFTQKDIRGLGINAMNLLCLKKVRRG